MKLTDEQVRELFELWISGADDTMPRPQRLSLIGANEAGYRIPLEITITRPVDYESLVGKAVLVRNRDTEPWIAAVLKTPEPVSPEYRVTVYFDTMYSQCIPFDPDKVGKVT